MHFATPSNQMLRNQLFVVYRSNSTKGRSKNANRTFLYLLAFIKITYEREIIFSFSDFLEFINVSVSDVQI